MTPAGPQDREATREEAETTTETTRSPSAPSPIQPEEADLTSSGRASVLTFVVVALNSVGNLAFHAFVARHDGTAGYGAVAALLSFGTVSGVLASGIQFAVARRTAQRGADPVTELGRGVRALGPWLGLSVVLAICSAPLASYLHLSGTEAVVFAAAYFASNIVQAVPLGILIGERKFVTWAAVVLIAVGARLIIVVAMGPFGDTETGALISSAGASGLSAAVGVLLIVAGHRRPRRSGAPALRGAGVRTGPVGASVIRSNGTVATPATPAGPPTATRPAAAGPSIAGTVEGTETGMKKLALEGIGGALLGAGLWTVWVLPVVFGRHFLSGPQSGRFASAQLLATGIIYLVGAVTTAFFPSVARHRSVHAVARGSILAAVVTAACVAGFVLLGPPVVRRVYGPSFVESRELMLILGVSVGVVAMATFFLWISRALRHITVLPAVGIVVALAVEFVLGSTWKTSALALASGPTIAFLVGGGAAGLVALALRGNGAHAKKFGWISLSKAEPETHVVVDANVAVALERSLDEEMMAGEGLFDDDPAGTDYGLSDGRPTQENEVSRS